MSNCLSQFSGWALLKKLRLSWEYCKMCAIYYHRWSKSSKNFDSGCEAVLRRVLSNTGSFSAVLERADLVLTVLTVYCKGKPIETVCVPHNRLCVTGLKPGVNENAPRETLTRMLRGLPHRRLLGHADWMRAQTPILKPKNGVELQACRWSIQ